MSDSKQTVRLSLDYYTFIERLAHDAVAHFRSVHFRGDEQLSAVCSAPVYAFAHLFLVSVALCRVDQAESDLDCMAYSFCGISMPLFSFTVGTLFISCAFV